MHSIEELAMLKQEEKFCDPTMSTADAVSYVAHRLKLVRLMKKMTLETVSSHLGISRKQLQNYETAQSNISVARLWELAKVLETDPSFFLEGINGKKTIISNENLELIRLFDKIKDNNIKQALLGILRKV